MIDLIIAPCGQLVTIPSTSRAPLRGKELANLGIIENGALGINVGNGTIEFCGPASGLSASMAVPSCPQIDASECVVTPGLIDCHTHLVWAGSRVTDFYRRALGESYAQVAGTGGGILSTVDAVRAASEDELYALTCERMVEMHWSGTTALEIKSGYGLSEEHELKMLRVVQRLRDSLPSLCFGTAMPAHAVPADWRLGRESYVQEAARITSCAAEHGLADFADIFVDPLAFNQQDAQVIADNAKTLGLELFVHADEFSDDRTAEWAAANGALAASHLGGIGPSGIEALAASNTIAVLLPGAMFYSGHGHYAPARKMIEAGCAVALASDHNPGTSLVYGLPLIMTLAALHMQMSPEECISACTINAAHVLGIADIAGSLMPGKRADICVFSVPDYREIPCHPGRDIVRDVLIRGRIIKRLGLPAH